MQLGVKDIGRYADNVVPINPVIMIWMVAGDEVWLFLMNNEDFKLLIPWQKISLYRYEADMVEHVITFNQLNKFSVEDAFSAVLQSVMQLMFAFVVISPAILEVINAVGVLTIVHPDLKDR